MQERFARDRTMGATDHDTIAARLLEAYDHGTSLIPFTGSDRTFDVDAAYVVLEKISRTRHGRGWRRVGRKIGFTNRGLWARYDVDRPMWAPVWRESVVDAPTAAASFVLERTWEPRIEPEVVFGLKAAVPRGADPATVLAATDWIAAGFEIVDSPFPGWKFRAPDCTAAFGLHRALIVGPRLAVDESRRDDLAARLSTFVLTLRRNGTVVEQGVGSNVLDSPAMALAHLANLLATQPTMPPLVGGELVTTGTLTDAWPVHAGEVWASDYGDLGVAAITLRVA